MKKQIIPAQTRIFWSAMYLKMPSEWHLKDSELQWFGKSLLAMIADLKWWKLSMTPWPFGLLNSGYDILVYGRTFTNNFWWTSGLMNNDAAKIQRLLIRWHWLDCTFTIKELTMDTNRKQWHKFESDRSKSSTLLFKIGKFLNFLYRRLLTLRTFT